MTIPRNAYIVVLCDDRGHRRPFGPARDQQSAEDVARKLRAWGMNALAVRGRVESGEFIPPADDPDCVISQELYRR